VELEVCIYRVFSELSVISVVSRFIPVEDWSLRFGGAAFQPRTRLSSRLDSRSHPILSRKPLSRMQYFNLNEYRLRPLEPSDPLG